MSAQVGERAPEFELQATGPDEKVRLSSLKGKPVVLLFYPFAFSGVCTEELCSVRDGLSEYQSLGAQVLAISGDAIHALRAWSKQEGFTFPLLSDYLRETIRAYDVETPGRGHAKRSAFVIDKDGVIRYRFVSDDARVIPPFDQVKDALKKVS